METAHWEDLTFLLHMEKQKATTHTDRQVNPGSRKFTLPKNEPAQRNRPWNGALGRRPLDKVNEGQSYCSSFSSNTKNLLHKRRKRPTW